MNKTVSLLAAGCAGLLLLTGCSAASASSSPSAAAAGGSRTARTPQASGTYGLIAAISGTTLQVQGANAQTAVTYSDSTTFTQQVTGAATDLKPGACVSVRGTTTSDTTAATAITVSDAVNGQCQGFGGLGGGGASRAPQGGVPSGAPRGGVPSGGASGAPGGNRGGFVVGTVASVADGTLTVTVTQQQGGATASASPSSATVTIGSAAITKTVKATAAAAKVGMCASVPDKPDTTGAVAATSIRLSDAVNGACTSR